MSSPTRSTGGGASTAGAAATAAVVDGVTCAVRPREVEAHATAPLATSTRTLTDPNLSGINPWRGRDGRVARSEEPGQPFDRQSFSRGYLYPSQTKTFAVWPASRAAGVMIVFSPTRIFCPDFTALRTSSSHTNSAGFALASAGDNGTPDARDGASDGALDALDACDAGALRPRDARNASMRRVSESAAIGSGAPFAGAWGSFISVGAAPAAPAERPGLVVAPDDGVFVSVPRARVPTGMVSYARRLILSKCRGEMLSDVIFPPKPPQPSVIAGSSPVVKPMAPSVAGVFTQM